MTYLLMPLQSKEPSNVPRDIERAIASSLGLSVAAVMQAIEEGILPPLIADFEEKICINLYVAAAMNIMQSTQFRQFHEAFIANNWEHQRDILIIMYGAEDIDALPLQH